MLTLMRHFLRDEAGSVVVGDWVFIAAILVLGAVAGAAVLHKTTPDEAESAPAASAPTNAGAAPVADHR
jgi:hypothetical protein